MRTKRWYDFLRLYAHVIEDGSLWCQRKAQRLKYVSKLVIKKGELGQIANLAPFDLAVHIVLIDGRSLTVDVSADKLPNGSPLLLSSIRFQK
jgi:hypothetical protein